MSEKPVTCTFRCSPLLAIAELDPVDKLDT